MTATVTSPAGGMPDGRCVRTRMIGMTPLRSCAPIALAVATGVAAVIWLSAFQICFSGAASEIFVARGAAAAPTPGDL